MSGFLILFDNNQANKRSSLRKSVYTPEAPYDFQEFYASPLYDEFIMGSSNRDGRTRDSHIGRDHPRPLSGVACEGHAQSLKQEQFDAVVEHSGWDDDCDDVTTSRPFKRTRSFIPAKMMERIEEVPEGTTDVPVIKKKRSVIRLSVFFTLFSRKRR